MGKLIKLLNEYENEEADVYIRYWNYYQNGFHLLEYGQTYSELLMISKKYGFIKWLVENDKIDRSKVLEEIGSCIKISGLGPHYSFYSALLMILAVSDTPIDDLISYLK